MRNDRPAARLLLPAMLMAGLVLLAYLPAVRAGYVWDDDSHITANTTLRTLGGLRSIWFEPGATMQYYPLTNSSWWVGYQLWGLDPLGYHVVTLLLHVAVSLLLWRVLRALGVPGAWLGAMIFALHPVNVMSVAWATELKNTLSGSLALGSCWAYLCFAGIGRPTASSRAPMAAETKPDDGDRETSARAWSVYALSLGLFVLALFAKTAICFLPATLLLIVWWKKGRLRRSDLLSLAPMAALAAATGLVTIYVEHHSGGAVGRVFSIPYLARLPIAGRSFWFYLEKIVFPYPLAFIYERWTVDPRDWRQWLAPAAAAALLAALFALHRRIGKGPFVTAMHYAIGTSGLIFVVVTYMTRYTFVSDHWQYFGAMSAAALAGAAISRISFHGRSAAWFDESGKRLAGRGGSPRERSGTGAISTHAPGAAVLLVLGALTFRQTLQYRDIETLWLTTIARSPRAWMAYINLGALRADQQRYAEAVALFDRAVEINPESAEALTNRANALLQLDEYQRASDDCTAALALEPDAADAYVNRGLADLHLGQYDRAASDLGRAIALDPQNVKAYSARGVVALQLQEFDHAIADLTRAIALGPDQAEPYINRGVAYLSVGKPDLAIADAARAIALAPSPVTYRNRGLAYGRAGRCEEAVRDDDRAIAMDGHYVDAYLDRARCFVQMKRYERARADLDTVRALGGVPDDGLLRLLDRASSSPE